jgi:polyhydroxyalkanoate synthesis regulator protein
MAVTRKMVDRQCEELELIKSTLEDYLEQKQEVLDNEESKDYPNEDRLDKLNDQIEILQEAIDNLETVIDILSEYE